MDKSAMFGKDFRKISSFLDHKTTANCIQFYYKNHKFDSFEKTKKKLDVGKQGKSFNALSLDILGEASVIATDAGHC